MKYLLLLVYVLICSAPLISQTDEVELPKYEGVQPTWQRIVQDDIRDQPFRGVNIQTLLEDGYMYYSATTDTMFEGTFEQTGYLLQKYDLSDGRMVWSDHREGPHNLDDYEYYNRLVANEEGNIVLFGSKKAGSKDNSQLPWANSRIGFQFSIRSFDKENGEEVDYRLSKDTITSVNSANFAYNFLDINRRYLIDNSVHGVNKYFGFRILPYDIDNSIDSSAMVEFRYYMPDTTSYIGSPRINYVKNGRMRVAVPGYHRNSGNRLIYDYIKYYEIDYRDLANIHVVDSFDISGRVPELLPHPAFFITYPEFGEHNMYIAQNHYTQGVQGTWIVWYDYDGNILGGHDDLLIEDLNEKVRFTYKNINVNDRYFNLKFLGQSKKEAVMIEYSPYYLPKELARIKCSNYELTSWRYIAYDEKHHQVILTTILNDDYNYIAAFDAESLGIAKPDNVQHPIVRIDFSVYPNPSSDVLTVNVQDGFAGEIQLYDLKGRLVHREQSSFESTHAIDVRDLAPGLYQLRLMSKTVVYEGKSFVKR